MPALDCRPRFSFSRLTFARIVVGLGIFFGAHSSGLTQGTLPDIERLHQIYESEAASLKSQYEASDALLHDQYSEAVGRFLRDAQGRGDFEGWQAGTREQERFLMSGKIEASDYVTTIQGLRAIQEKTVDSRVKLRAAYAKKVTELNDKLVARFEMLKRDFTIRGDAYSAKQAVSAIDRARAAVSYLDALMIIDDPTEALPVRDATNGGASEGSASTPERAFNLADTPGVRVHPVGRSSPSIGATYRLCQLMSTPAGAKSDILVTARYIMHSRAAMRFQDRQYTTDAVSMQVTLRMPHEIDPLRNVTLVVEYFGRRNVESVEPLTYASVKLASIDSRQVTVDMPMTSYQIKLRESAFGGVRRQFDQGLLFGGVMISVFSSTGEVLYQSVMARSLLGETGGASRYAPDGVVVTKE